MYIDRILFPIETLGAGKRLVIWTRGCSKHCLNCANPELWSLLGEKNYPTDEIVKIIFNIYKEAHFDGITITGGDPLEQKEDLLSLLDSLSKLTEDILVYTGYLLAEIEELWTGFEIQKLKKNIAVLIDGRYIDEMNMPNTVLRGSSNQKLYFFKSKYEPLYHLYMKKGRMIQNVYMGKKFISVGIHNRKGDK